MVMPRQGEAGMSRASTAMSIIAVSVWKIEATVPEGYLARSSLVQALISMWAMTRSPSCPAPPPGQDVAASVALLFGDRARRGVHGLQVPVYEIGEAGLR